MVLISRNNNQQLSNNNFDNYYIAVTNNGDLDYINTESLETTKLVHYSKKTIYNVVKLKSRIESDTAVFIINDTCQNSDKNICLENNRVNNRLFSYIVMKDTEDELSGFSMNEISDILEKKTNA